MSHNNDLADEAANPKGIQATTDVNMTECPVTWKAYLLCAFASFGVSSSGLTAYSGYDSGYINGVLNSPLFIQEVEGPICPQGLDTPDGLCKISSGNTSLIVSILSAGVVLQMAATGRDLLVAGRAIAGIGVGFESAIVILYMSEICPKKVRGALVSGYQFCITIGLLLAACVNYGVQDSCVHPTDPQAAELRSMVEFELAEIIANEEYERELIPAGGWISGWANCFKGSLFQSNSNLRKTILGTLASRMMQQWTGVNFIFYYSTPFLESTGAISNTFLISLVFTLVNVCSTPLSFYGMEKFGRRTLLLLVLSGFNNSTTLADGTTRANNISAVNAQIAFIAIFIFFFATTWGPGAWVLIGEVFPLPIRSRGVALSTASNWLWNTIIAVITPYMVGTDKGNLKSSTKGLSLEQVDQMMAETTPRTSAKWRPTHTFVESSLQKDGETV
ncbi:hypothetical protein BKA58DRAFT_428361 [Alternaria rosae]|uniref:uncharacterized protein n=1 Tax=Alternaria rosae TaxID=1187941 RepID=UPI001E8D30AC|nr:uncharacterized protein BKA58DRAFT_428361 [Alternaria rosae]KAH6876206.1 hypothetical protein BKA58DRAFT_428361 [Alternaria rosae]